MNRLSYQRLLLLIISLITYTFAFSEDVVAYRYHNKPKAGDLCIKTDNGFQYIRSQDFVIINSSDISNSIGVVYNVKGRKAKVLGGVFSKPTRWSNATLFSVTKNNVPNKSTQLPIYLLKENKPRGLFDYQYSDGSVREYIEQLNNWFLVKGLSDWSAYIKNNNGYVQYTGIVDDAIGYDLRIGEQIYNRVTVTAAGVKIEESYCRNQIKQSKWVCGMNRIRMEEHCRERQGQDANPLNATMIDGKNILYDIIPVSEGFYNKSVTLKKSYKRYSDYLDACMVRYKDKRYGIMKYKSGKAITEKLANATLSIGDSTQPSFPAAFYSHNYKANANDEIEWWLPSMYELALIMEDPDKINKGLSLNPQWNTVQTNVYYWSCCPCNTYYVWFYHFDGMSDVNNMCGADKNGNLFIRALPVTEITF